MAKRVAVLIDGEITVHMDARDGNYDTLCGLDENDPDIGLEPADVPLNGHARINCPDCWGIFLQARRYIERDFTAEVKRRRD